MGEQGPRPTEHFLPRRLRPLGYLALGLVDSALGMSRSRPEEAIRAQMEGTEQLLVDIDEQLQGIAQEPIELRPIAGAQIERDDEVV